MHVEKHEFLPVERMYSKLDKGRHTTCGQTNAAHTSLQEQVTGQSGCLATSFQGAADLIGRFVALLVFFTKTPSAIFI